MNNLHRKCQRDINTSFFKVITEPLKSVWNTGAFSEYAEFLAK